MHLPLQEFKALIKNGILLSIDLIIKNDNDEVLIGKRKNNPAKDFWFVPGGRVFKHESFREALDRICNAEVGRLINPDQFRKLGLYNHIYEGNFFDDPGFNTHYIAIGVELSLSNIRMNAAMDHQHDEHKFISIEALLNDAKVHDNTKYYFTKQAPNRFY